MSSCGEMELICVSASITPPSYVCQGQVLAKLRLLGHAALRAESFLSGPQQEVFTLGVHMEIKTKVKKQNH